MEEKKEIKTYLLDDGTEGSRAAYIRQEFLKGRTRSDIAKELGVPFGIVYSATANMDNGTTRQRGGNSKMIELSDGTKMPRSEYIKQEFLKGKSRGDIAKELGVAYQVVFAATKGMDNGTTSRKGGRAMIAHPETGELVSRTELIRELFAQGKTRREIANMLHVDYAVVWSATKSEKGEEEQVEDEKSAVDIAMEEDELPEFNEVEDNEQ